MDHSPGLCGFDEDNELFFSLEAQPTTNVIRVFEERVAQTETKNEKELHSLIQTEIMKSSTQLQETSIQKNDAQNSNKNEVLQSPSTNEESQHLNSKDISTNFKVTTRKKQEISELEQWLQDLELQEEEEEKRKEEDAKRHEVEKTESEKMDNFVSDFNKELTRFDEFLTKTYSLLKSKQKDFELTLRELEKWKKEFVRLMDSKRQKIDANHKTSSTEINKSIQHFRTHFDHFLSKFEQLSNSQEQQHKSPFSDFSQVFPLHNDIDMLQKTSTLTSNKNESESNTSLLNHLDDQNSSDDDEKYFSLSDEDIISSNLDNDKDWSEIDQLFKEMNTVLSSIEHIVNEPLHCDFQLNTHEFRPQQTNTTSNSNNNNTNLNKQTQVVDNINEKSSNNELFPSELFQNFPTSSLRKRKKLTDSQSPNESSNTNITNREPNVSNSPQNTTKSKLFSRTKSSKVN